MVERGQFDISCDLSYVPIGWVGEWIEYIQWNGINLEECKQLTMVYRTPEMVNKLTVKTVIGEIMIGTEFYILKGPGGDVYVMDPSVFNKMILTEEDLKTNLNGRKSFED